MSIVGGNKVHGLLRVEGVRAEEREVRKRSAEEEERVKVGKKA